MIFPAFDFIPFTDSEMATDAPASALHFERWFKNHIATVQGAKGAERVQPRALESNALGVISNAASPGVFTGLGKMRSLRLSSNFKTGAGNIAFQVSFSANAGSTWGGWQSIYTIAGNSQYSGVLELDIVSGAFAATFGQFAVSGTLVVPANCNAVRFQGSGATLEWAAFGEISGGRSDVV